MKDRGRVNRAWALPSASSVLEGRKCEHAENQNMHRIPGVGVISKG